ncbi:MAG: AI-2E family transporter [Methanonatronarchaeia archaeon]|nr:MAG: AI-2E family transporter [Methanonatronarchaeia archaeon]
MTRIFGETPRKILLLAALVLAVFFTLWVFSAVVWTFVFAVTIVYTLYPLYQALRRRGISEFLSSIISTFMSFLAILLLAAPFFIVIYTRRDVLFDFLRDVPESFTFDVLGFEFTVETVMLVELSREYITETAIEVAQATPAIVLQFFLLIVFIYALLYKSRAISELVLGMFPESFEEILQGYNDKIKYTTIGLYVVQLSTGVLTFLIGLPFFYFLGYDPFISLALIAGILQFIPVIGPSILVIALALFEILVGEFIFGVTVLATGLLFLSGLPDLLLRPYLADIETGLSPSQYFIGFIGGLVTIGALGIIVGPLVLAILIKTADIMSDRT